MVATGDRPQEAKEITLQGGRLRLPSFFFPPRFEASPSPVGTRGGTIIHTSLQNAPTAFLRAPRGIRAHLHPYTRVHIHTHLPTKRFKGPYSLALTQDGINTQPHPQNAPTAFLRAPRPIPSHPPTYTRTHMCLQAPIHALVSPPILGTPLSVRSASPLSLLLALLASYTVPACCTSLTALGCLSSYRCLSVPLHLSLPVCLWLYICVYTCIGLSLHVPVWVGL